MSKTTASIPKSRSKYLIQFLKSKVEGSHINPSLSPEKQTPVHNNIEGVTHRRGINSEIPNAKMDEDEYNYQESAIYEEEKDSIYQTPKNYSTRRRIKKISLESTNYTSSGTIVQNSRFQRKRDCKRLNTSHERIKQVNISDQSIEEIDEEEEPLSIPYSSPTKQGHNNFFERISKAADTDPTNAVDPYSLWFEPELGINKMIDDIINNDHTKFSDGNEKFCPEESKDESFDDIQMEQINELEITPELKIDDMVSHCEGLERNTVFTRDQKKSFKYLNKFQNCEGSAAKVPCTNK